MKIGISIPGILDGLNNRVGDMFGWSPPVRGLWWVKVDVFNKNHAPQRDTPYCCDGLFGRVTSVSASQP